jgi:hypothetical protein
MADADKKKTMESLKREEERRKSAQLDDYAHAVVSFHRLLKIPFQSLVLPF